MPWPSSSSIGFAPRPASPRSRRRSYRRRNVMTMVGHRLRDPRRDPERGRRACGACVQFRAAGLLQHARRSLVRGAHVHGRRAAKRRRDHRQSCGRATFLARRQCAWRRGQWSGDWSTVVGVVDNVLVSRPDAQPRHAAVLLAVRKQSACRASLGAPPTAHAHRARGRRPCGRDRFVARLRRKRSIRRSRSKTCC